MQEAYAICFVVVLGWLWLLRRPFSKPGSVAIVVLGDFGRSPRMQVSEQQPGCVVLLGVFFYST